MIQAGARSGSGQAFNNRKRRSRAQICSRGIGRRPTGRFQARSIRKAPVRIYAYLLILRCRATRQGVLGPATHNQRYGPLYGTDDSNLIARLSSCARNRRTFGLPLRGAKAVHGLVSVFHARAVSRCCVYSPTALDVRLLLIVCGHVERDVSNAELEGRAGVSGYPVDRNVFDGKMAGR